MKTATVRDLRNRFAQISRWIENGEAVEITKLGKSFARLIPQEGVERKAVQFPDFAARLREDFPQEATAPDGTLQSIQDYDRGER